MPRDRLAELKDRSDGDPPVPEVAIDVDVGNTDGKEMTSLRDFFQEVDDIKAGIAAVKKKVHEIEQFHSKALSAIGGENHLDNEKSLDDMINSTDVYIQDVRNKLKAMEAKNKDLGIENSNKQLSAEQRMRLSQHGNITKKFMETMTEYQEIQTKYKNKYRDRLERQFKIVKPDATAAEIEHALESGTDGSSLFAQQILMGAQHAEAKRALYDIQERHQDIIRIEKSILELHQLFLDMAILVNAQGDMIDQIEHYVNSAADHTNKGVEAMTAAVKQQKKSRKRMCCIFFGLMLLILAVVILVTSKLFCPSSKCLRSPRYSLGRRDP